MERDTNLDCYRGFAIIWVLFIHSIFWMAFFSSPKMMILKSYLLLEMPLLFFISGASYSLTKNTDNLFRFYLKRIERIVIPYWVYAFLSVFLIQMTITCLHIPGKISYKDWFIIFNFKQNLWTNIPILTAHLWFIPVFLLIIFFIPLLRFAYNNLVNKSKFIPLIVIGVLIFILDSNKLMSGWVYYYLKNILFYSFWIYSGLFYKDMKDKTLNKKLIVIVAVFSYFAMYILIKNGYSTNMQVNKFPPNTAFLMMNIGHLSILIFLKDYILKFLSTLNLKNYFAHMGKFSYTVYLYQVFGFMLGMMILDIFKIDLYKDNMGIIGSFYYLLINLFTSLLFIKIFGKIETVHFSFRNYFFRKVVSNVIEK